MEFRLRDFVYPLDIIRARGRFEHSQYWNQRDRQLWQSAHLRELLLHARATSRFWRDRLSDAIAESDFGDPSALARLPILDKDTLRSVGDAPTSIRADEFAPCWKETSGSTGTPLRFALDKPTNVLEFATLWRQFNWCGYRFGQRFADLRGHLVRNSSGIAFDRRLNSLNLSSFRLSRDRVASYAAALTQFAPVMIRGYPSSLSLFSSWALEDGVRLPSPLAVVTSSETLLGTQRDLIERAFRAPVFDYYGQMERVAFIGQCASGSYHVAEEYGLVELLDANDQPVPPGREGRIVATGFHHRAQPFIRYDTRDLAVWSDRLCACGRTGRNIAAVTGRIEDFVVTPDGRHVGRLDAAFKRIRGLSRARIIQERLDTIRVEVVASSAFDRTERDRLLADLRDRLGLSIAIHIVTVEELPLEESGKFRFVVSRLGNGPVAGQPSP